MNKYYLVKWYDSKRNEDFQEEVDVATLKWLQNNFKVYWVKEA